MSQPERPGRAAAFWFDLRTCIAALFGVYGAVCLVWGLAFTDRADLRKSGGVHLNTWSGVGMLVLSALFLAWVLLRPIRPDEEPQRTDAP